MITIASQNGKYSVSYQCDYASPSLAYAYTRSKSMLRVKIEDPLLQTTSTVNITFGAGGITHTTIYYTDPNGVLEIPTKNELNKWLAKGVNAVAITITPHKLDGTLIDGNVAIPLNIFEGISYNDLNAPRNKEMQDWIGAYSTAIIVPPNVIINPAQLNGITAAGTIVESNFHINEKDWDWSEIAGGVSAIITPTGARSNQLPVAAGSDILQVTDGSKTKRWQLEKPDYCADLVCIRWKSMTGATRQHYFPIVGRIKSTDKAVSLVSAGDGYEVDKNAVDGIRCRLTGLTSYGYWYYMDLLQSSDVHAIIRPTYSIWETEISSAQTAVFVEAGEMEQPQGTGFFNFEFTLKLRHYDTV